MKRTSLFLIYFVCSILQITIVPHFSLFGTSPDLILVMTIVFSFFYENFNGVIFGVIFGIIRDICVGPAAGVSAAMLLLIGGGLQLVRFAVYRDNKLILFFICALCTVVYYLGCWGIVMLLLEYRVAFASMIMKIPVAVFWNYAVLLATCHFARKTEGFTV